MVYQKCFDWGFSQICERSTHTAPQETGYGPQAERPRDGYRYSFLLSSALILVIELRSLQPTAVQCTYRCDRNACYNLLRLFFV